MSRLLYIKFIYRSVKQTWHIDSISFYAAKLAAQSSMPKPIQGIVDDIHQMGGDFIIDSEGRLKFAYRSPNPSDRPSIQTIVQTMKSIVGDSNSA